MKDLSSIVKSIRLIKEKNYKGVVSHKIELVLINDAKTKISVPSDDVELIKTIKSVGFENPVKSMKLLEEENDTGSKYYCINLVLADADDDILKYFFDIKFKRVIDILLSFEANKNKENKKIN